MQGGKLELKLRKALTSTCVKQQKYIPSSCEV